MEPVYTWKIKYDLFHLPLSGLPLFKGFFKLMVFSHGPRNGKTLFTETETPSEVVRRIRALNHWHITQNHAVP